MELVKCNGYLAQFTMANGRMETHKVMVKCKVEMGILNKGYFKIINLK